MTNYRNIITVKTFDIPNTGIVKLTTTESASYTVHEFRLTCLSEASRLSIATISTKEELLKIRETTSDELGVIGVARTYWTSQESILTLLEACF